MVSRLFGAVAGRSFGGWLAAFLGYFLLFGAWALATPYNGTPDEAQHVIRAAGVVRGQFTPAPANAFKGTGAFQSVPKSLDQHTPCFAFDPTKTASCARPLNGDRTPTRVGTAAGRYNPAYYAMVGWPLRWWPTMTGVLAARLISVAFVAAFIAGAFVCLRRHSRHRIALGGLLVAVTPMTAHLAGALNPNAIEIAAGVAAFAALVPMLTGPPARPTRAHVALAGLALVTLATVRSIGPLWLAIIAVVFLVPNRWERLRTLWRSWAVRGWMAAATAAGLLGVVWTVAMRAGELIPIGRAPLTLYEAVKTEVFQQWSGLPDQMVGVMAWLDLRLPWFVYVLWYLGAGSLIITGLQYGRRVDRWRLLLLATLGAGSMSILEVVAVNRFGFVSQGRYLLPVMVGVPILAGYVLGAAGTSAQRAGSTVRVLAVMLLPLHLLALAWTMVRYQSGVRNAPLNPLAGEWQPAVGPLTPLLLATSGIVVIAVLVWGAGRHSGTVDDLATDDTGSAAPAWSGISAEDTATVGPAINGPADGDPVDGAGYSATRPDPATGSSAADPVRR